jgi:DNA-directed RNA polymerase omega subunit
MAKITSEKAIDMIGNKYNLILIAAIRARELKAGQKSKVKPDNGFLVTALKEIEEGHIGVEYLSRISKKKSRK